MSPPGRLSIGESETTRDDMTPSWTTLGAGHRAQASRGALISEAARSQVH